MKISIGAYNNGITLTYGEDVPVRRVRNPQADQTRPRRCYVYAHTDPNGTPFYIGKGVGRRAWSDDRDRLWHRYVEKHLKGSYSIVILEDDLTPDQADEMESNWIAQESETLVNLTNMSRPTDFKASARYHELRNANLSLIAEAKAKESADLEGAIQLYKLAQQMLAEYATIQPELGLVGKLIDEDIAENGLRGELRIIDRLTLCLIGLGRGAEAKVAAEHYFATYRADAQMKAKERIDKRIAKAARG